jgi:hypothetical protein
MTELPTVPNLNSLVELGRREGVDIRPTLLRVMTDLYVQTSTHSAEEERHFTELALRLIELVDPATRAAVTERIAAYPNAPAAVRRRLLRDKIVLATPADTTSMARDVSPKGGQKNELSELFFAATAEERRLILLNLPYAPWPAAKPIPPSAAREAIDRLEAAALSHNTETFVRELERSLRIPRAHGRRMVDDDSGEPVVVAAVALGMPAAVLQRILLCLNPTVSRSVQRVYDLAVLHEEIERDSALRLLAIWQSSGETARAVPSPPAPARPQRNIDPNARALPPARPKIEWDTHAKSRHSEGA